MSNARTKEETRDEFLGRIDKLYAQAENWIHDFCPDAQIRYEEITLKEEPVEPYLARIMVIERPTYKTVRLIPRGAWIIGVEGRIDMKSDLGTETLVYVSEGGPAIKINTLTENGKILQEGKERPIAKDVAEGWVFIQNRQLGMLPTLDAELFYRLLEVLGR